MSASKQFSWIMELRVRVRVGVRVGVSVRVRVGVSVRVRVGVGVRVSVRVRFRVCLSEVISSQIDNAEVGLVHRLDDILQIRV